ncbi:MAG TPA: hypothetical protein ENN99_15120 [Chloroflexi bacterium]|nr:hypothetical protein [Chloroflexota bacterium]
MKTEMKSNQEQGQVLVIMVFGLILLLVIAGLAIDGGTVFLERRRMQNAADAGALAGTRQLAQSICGEESAAATDAAVFDAVSEYVIDRNHAGGFEASYVRFEGRNVVQFSPRVLVGSGVVPNGAAGVAVTATVTRSTYFMTLVGIHEAGAAAPATAVTGPPLMMGGLRPFGVPNELASTVPVNSGADSCFTLNFRANCKNDDDCTVEYIDGHSSAHRGWMNFDFIWQHREYSGWPRALDNTTNANVLADWMENGWDGTLYADCMWSEGCYSGDYVDAKPGQTQSVFWATPIDELFYVPIYDAVPDCPDKGKPLDIVAPYPEDPYPGPRGDEACSGGQTPAYYHVVGFAGVIVPPGGVAHGGGNGSITVCLQETIMGQGQPSPNNGFGHDPCSTRTMVVVLWK